MPLQQIAERCQQGDHEAFAQLYTAMREPLRAACLHYVQDDAVADDLLHDTFLLIFSKIGHLKDTARAEAWMTMVARRVSLLYLRQRKQQRQVPLSACATTSLQPPTEGNRAESSLAMQELLAAVDALPDGYRRVLRLFVLDGLTHQEIATLLHIDPHSSSSQLFHAKALLRRRLRPLLLLLLAVALPLTLLWKSLAPTQTVNPITLTPDTIGQRETRKEAKDEGSNCPLAAIQEKKDTVVEKTQPPTLPLEKELEEPADTCLFDDHSPCHVVSPHEHHSPRRAVPSHENPSPRRVVSPHEHSKWHLQLAYSCTTGTSSMHLPYADAEKNPVVYDSLGNHNPPLTISLSMNYHLDSHWQLGTGLIYTRQTSDFCSGNSYVSMQQHQTVQQLGIPVSLSYQWQLAHHWQLYVLTNATLHLPLRTTLHSHYLMPDGTKAESTTEHLHQGVQWSMGIGTGIQYDLTPHVSFFVEPSVQHYFHQGTGVSTWTTEHDLVPLLPIGLKITF